MTFDSPDHVWKNLIRQILQRGNTIAPRGLHSIELLCNQSGIEMRNPILLDARRKLSYRFMAAEAHWILTGDNRVTEYVKELRPYSDNGETLFGAYGPHFVEQYGSVLRTLQGDESSRQAVMTFWRKCPGPSKDIPCTVSLQFLIRAGKLHCHSSMRSSDVWLGWPYDVFSFSMIGTFILLALRNFYPRLELGILTITAGSQHLYERDWDNARRCLESTETIGSISSICIDNVISPDNLLTYLDCARRAPDSYNYLIHGKT
jgi:thymidylate synthase